MKLFANGVMVDAEAPLLTATNRGFRYGDGIFETIKVIGGKPLLWHLHWARLQQGMEVLELTHGLPPASQLLEEVAKLCTHNGCSRLARVRLAVYRVEDRAAGYVLEANALDTTALQLNEKGWKLTVYPKARKPVDVFANLKSANYLLYAMAGRFAEQAGCNEALVLNAHGRIADGSRTNLFILKRDTLLTPAQSEGGVAGVMRAHLLQHCLAAGIAVQEATLTTADLLNADEVLLTNAIQGIRWVDRFEDRRYSAGFAHRLHQEALATIYAPLC